MTRIVEPRFIPNSLWDPLHPATKECAAGCLHLPPRFCSAYIDLLTETDLLARAQEAETGNENGPTGAADDGGAAEHLARRFDGSAARTQLYVLDPNDSYATTSDALFSLLAGGTSRILDAPIGAGAASALLLSIAAELRVEAVLARNPTEITVVGGDADVNALALAGRLFSKLRLFWLENAIQVSLKTREWDVASDESTGDLLDCWADGIHKNDRSAVVVANFSGFLWSTYTANQKRNIEDVSPNIRQILLRATKVGAPIFWIESQRKHVGQMFKWLEENISPKFRRLTPAFPSSRQSKATAKSPVKSGATFTARSQGIHWRTSVQ